MKKMFILAISKQLIWHKVQRK